MKLGVEMQPRLPPNREQTVANQEQTVAANTQAAFFERQTGMLMTNSSMLPYIAM